MTFEIPKEKLYLKKYFKNELQRTFLKYFMVMGEVKNFTDHTGYVCCRRLLYLFKKRYFRITQSYDKAKLALTEESMEKIRLIEGGKFPLTKLLKS